LGELPDAGWEYAEILGRVCSAFLAIDRLNLAWLVRFFQEVEVLSGDL
jgi:hypothetical protein